MCSTPSPEKTVLKEQLCCTGNDSCNISRELPVQKGSKMLQKGPKCWWILGKLICWCCRQFFDFAGRREHWFLDGRLKAQIPAQTQKWNRKAGPQGICLQLQILQGQGLQTCPFPAKTADTATFQTEMLVKSGTKWTKQLLHFSGNSGGEGVSPKPVTQQEGPGAADAKTPCKRW